MPTPDLALMTTVYVLLLLKGPRWALDRADGDPLHERHLAYLYSLRQSGRLIMVGPVFDDSDVQGFGVYRVDSFEEARALAEADPAVQAGRFLIELHPWMVEKYVLPENVPPA